jgi:hypothetical protein
LTVFLTTRIRTDVTDFLFGESAAIGAVADFRHRPGERLRQTHPAATIALKQRERHTLRRLRANAR